METIPGYTPHRPRYGEPVEAWYRERVELHYFGCGIHREVLAPGELATPHCPKCGPGDLRYDGWGEKLRSSWGTSSEKTTYVRTARRVA